MMRRHHDIDTIVPRFKDLVSIRLEARTVWSDYLSVLGTHRNDAVDCLRHLRGELRHPPASAPDKILEEVTAYYEEYKDFLD